MIDEELNSLINNVATSTAATLVTSLKREHLIKNRRSAYQKVELLLYNYTDFKELIKTKEKEIKIIREIGLDKKSKDITMGINNGNAPYVNELEKIEDKIVEIENSIKTTQRFIGIIDSALEKISTDHYFDVIRLYYFERLSREVIADRLKVLDVKTISRNKRRLMEKLKMDLFSGDAIAEIFNS